MNIAEKLITVANNTPAVADAVNSAKATAIGAVVRVDDVLDVEYPLQIQTTPGEKVTVIGKNYFDISNVKTTSAVINNGDGTIEALKFGTSSNTILREVCPELKVGDIVFLSFNTTSSTKQIYLVGAKTAWYNDRSLTITQDMLDSALVFYCVRNAEGETSPATISNIQVEQGTEATQFEPYKAPQTATADASGKVSGLVSVSPTMTLMADNDAVALECTYFPASAADSVAKYQQLKAEETALQEYLREHKEESV